MKSFGLKAFASKALILALVLSLLSSLLCLPAGAEGELANDTLTVSEDYETVTYNGRLYTRIYDRFDNSSEHSKDIPNSKIILTEEQQKHILSINAHTAEIYVYIYIIYQSGNEFMNVYIDSDRLEEYNTFAESHGDKASLRQAIYLNDSIDINYDRLLGEAIVQKGYELCYYKYLLEVTSYSSNGVFAKTSGEILRGDDGNYYYLDYYRFGQETARILSDEYDRRALDEVTLYKITDSEIIDFAESADDNHYYDGEDDFGYDDDTDDSFTTFIGSVFFFILTVVFLFVPFAIMIICVIFAIKKRKPYRFCFLTISILCAIEIITFIAATLIYILGAMG